jgi:hypothetical protein
MARKRQSKGARQGPPDKSGALTKYGRIPAAYKLAR